jgi:hypothetical protein
MCGIRPQQLGNLPQRAFSFVNSAYVVSSQISLSQFQIPILDRGKRSALARHYLSVGTTAPVSGPIMKSPFLFSWYCIRRARHQRPVFQAIRYALWLAR